MGGRLVYIVLVICLFSVQLTSCSDAPTELLDKAGRLWGHDMDSANMYLSQIEHPHSLVGYDKMRYCYLKGVIDFYSSGKKSDSLFAEAKEEALFLSDSLYIKKLMVRNLVAASYRNTPDSAMNVIDGIKETFPVFADSMYLQLLVYRGKSLLEKHRYQDVVNCVEEIDKARVKDQADSSLCIRVMVQAMDACFELHRNREADSIYTYIRFIRHFE